MKNWDVIVIGGGIIGLSLAIELRKQAAGVLLVERGEPGREASHAAGGMLVDCPAEMCIRDRFHPLRDLLRANDTKRQSQNFPGLPPGSPDFLRRLRSRSGGPAQGRWSLLGQYTADPISTTQWSANLAQQLLVRHGIVLRETAIAENVPRGYPTLYPALKTMEDAGWVRRGMFVAGLGAAQFAMPAAVDMLRGLRSQQETLEALFLAATDPANPYGALLPWPRRVGSSESEMKDATAADSAGPSSANDGASSHAMSRTSGAAVVLINGNLTCLLYTSRCV